MEFYILNGHYPELITGNTHKDILIKWAEYFEKQNRRIDHTSLFYYDQKRLIQVDISTIFIGIDSSFTRNFKQLFETMIFGGPYDQFTRRCGTYRDAQKQHNRIVNFISKKLG